MYSGALGAIILVGNLKVIMIALGWTAVVACGVLWILQGFVDYKRGWTRGLTVVFATLFTLTWVGCLAVYNLPALKEEIVIAKQVAPILDDYAERYPESVYNPDVVLTALDDTVKGIVGTAIELPKYINRLASGVELLTRPLSERPIEDLSRAELEQRLRNAEGGRR